MTTSMSNSSASSLLRLLVGPLLPTCGPPTLFLSNKVFCAIFQKSVLRTSFDSGSTATEKFTSISSKFSSLSLSKNSKAKISSIVLGIQKPQIPLKGIKKSFFPSQQHCQCLWHIKCIVPTHMQNLISVEDYIYCKSV